MKISTSRRLADGEAVNGEDFDSMEALNAILKENYGYKPHPLYHDIDTNTITMPAMLVRKLAKEFINEIMRIFVFF